MGRIKNMVDKVAEIKASMRETYNHMVELQDMIEAANRLLPDEYRDDNAETGMLSVINSYHLTLIECHRSLYNLNNMTDSMKTYYKLRKQD